MKKVIFIILILLTSSGVRAENYELFRKKFSTGLMLTRENSYIGAKDLYPFILPLPYIDLENQNWLIRGDKGVLRKIYENNRFSSSMGLYYYVPRTPSMAADGKLDGIHEVKLDFPVVWHNRLYIAKLTELTLRLEQGVVEPSSQKYILAITRYFRLKQWFLEGSIGSTWGSAGYVNNWFGISQNELGNNGYFLKGYEAKNKVINPVSLFVESYIHYDFSYNYSTLVGARYGRLWGDVVNSPIVEDKNQMFFMVAFLYKFY
ncbi:MAG: MipA/OmpV family protein [Alphaproteobacteria bacterium]|jgi:outer membrane scaffolding protein for murein synthesis (MipA/OmpV family)|nr:MipA/OmpV family protein [Alphaproteobacteria bacterium]